MTIYKRGSRYWYRFMFKGQIVRESSNSESRTVAREAEKQRRYELERAVNHLPKPRLSPMFSAAAKDWLPGKTDKATKTVSGYKERMKPVVAVLGKRLLCDLSADDVLSYRATRSEEGAANRTINMEVGIIRGTLKKYRMWADIAEEFAARDVKVKLREKP